MLLYRFFKNFVIQIDVGVDGVHYNHVFMRGAALLVCVNEGDVEITDAAPLTVS